MKLDMMTFDDYENLLNSDRGHYYIGRWEYFEKTISLIKNKSFNSVIELGPGLMPIVKNADIIVSPEEDQFGKPDNTFGKKYIFNATIKSWPVENKKYDLFIALQVWEHLDNKQSRAFREVMRISRNAILSFPYLWEGGGKKVSHNAHRDIDKQLIHDWTLNIKPETIIEIPRTGEEFSKGPRIIYYWNFT